MKSYWFHALNRLEGTLAEQGRSRPRP